MDIQNLFKNVSYILFALCYSTTFRRGTASRSAERFTIAGSKYRAEIAAIDSLHAARKGQNSTLYFFKRK
jgi:hypothetical protein